MRLDLECGAGQGRTQGQGKIRCSRQEKISLLPNSWRVNDESSFETKAVTKERYPIASASAREKL